MKAILAAVCAALLATAFAGPPARADSAAEFADFLATARSYCPRAPAPACVDRLWLFVDRDRDGAIQLAEAETMQRAAQGWSEAVERQGKDEERDVALLALLVVKGVGLPQIFAGFDGNADGGLTRAELLADFRLDQRPFGAIVADREAVDWPSFAARFGALGGLLTPPPATP